jgi:flagellar protein FliO/FliZ
MLPLALLLSGASGLPQLQQVSMREGAPLAVTLSFSAPPSSGAEVRPEGPHGLTVLIPGARTGKARAHTLTDGWRAWVSPSSGGAVQVQLFVDRPHGCAFPARVHTLGNTLLITADCGSTAAGSVNAPANRVAAQAPPPPAQATPAQPEPARALIPPPPTSTPAPVPAPAPAAVASAQAPSTPTTPATASAPPAPWSLPPPAAPPPGDATPWFMLLLLLAASGVAVFLVRRRQNPLSGLEVLQTQSLGPKRSLVVARMQERTWVLSCSESGVQLLAEMVQPPAPPPVMVDAQRTPLMQALSAMAPMHAASQVAPVNNVAPQGPLAPSAPVAPTSVASSSVNTVHPFQPAQAVAPVAPAPPEPPASNPTVVTMPQSRGASGVRPAPPMQRHEFEQLLEQAGEEAVLRERMRPGSRGRIA